MISANQEDVPRAQFSYNFDYEHQVVRRLSNSDQAPGYTLGNSPPAVSSTIVTKTRFMF